MAAKISEREQTRRVTGGSSIGRQFAFVGRRPHAARATIPHSIASTAVVAARTVRSKRLFEARLREGHVPADDESRDDRASEAAIDRSCRDPPALLSKEAAGRSVHRTGVPARTDCKTSRIAWVDAFASTPEMSESCVAVSDDAVNAVGRQTRHPVLRLEPATVGLWGCGGDHDKRPISDPSSGPWAWSERCRQFRHGIGGLLRAALTVDSSAG